MDRKTLVRGVSIATRLVLGTMLTSSRVQPPPASLTLEVLCFLMIDQDFQIIKISLTVVTPWPGQGFFNVGVTPLLLSHADGIRVLETESTLRFVAFDSGDVKTWELVWVLVEVKSSGKGRSG